MTDRHELGLAYRAGKQVGAWYDGAAFSRELSLAIVGVLRREDDDDTYPAGILHEDGCLGDSMAVRLIEEVIRGGIDARAKR